MPLPSLAHDVAETILQAILDGDYDADQALPSEFELAEQIGVSRLTVREGVKLLHASNVVRVQQGRGTFVNSPTAWTGLEPLVRAEEAKQGTESGMVARRLIEARKLIEVGVAEIAATRRTDGDLRRLDTSLGDMIAAADKGNIEKFVETDLEFHGRIMTAAGNVFISAMFAPLAVLLLQARWQTSAVDVIRRHAIDHHRAILDAMRSANPVRARAAMLAHIEQTENDLMTYILVPAAPKPLKAR